MTLYTITMKANAGHPKYNSKTFKNFTRIDEGCWEGCYEGSIGIEDDAIFIMDEIESVTEQTE